MRSLDDVRVYYEGKLREFGPTAKGVDWNGETSQRVRFDQLTRVLDRLKPDDRVSVLDIGCGYGALAGYLRERFTSFRYVGYDISAEMTGRAAAIYGGDEALSFTSEQERIPTCDYAIASGVFNVKLGAGDDEWLAHTLETLAFIDSRASRGWAANFLTRYSDPERMTSRLYYADPLYLFDWCKTKISKWVSLLHDYGLYEFTLIVRKE